MTNRGIPLIARIVQITVILSCIVGSLWIGMRFFEPIPIPPGPKTQRSVMFDKSSDISGNSVFSGLQQYGPSKVEVGETGRVNPFTPLSPPIKTTSTATSTKAVIDSDVKATTETTGTAMEAI